MLVLLLLFGLSALVGLVVCWPCLGGVFVAAVVDIKVVDLVLVASVRVYLEPA